MTTHCHGSQVDHNIQGEKGCRRRRGRNSPLRFNLAMLHDPIFFFMSSFSPGKQIVPNFKSIFQLHQDTTSISTFNFTSYTYVIFLIMMLLPYSVISQSTTMLCIHNSGIIDILSSFYQLHCL
jgi:hypothetical protein